MAFFGKPRGEEEKNRPAAAPEPPRSAPTTPARTEAKTAVIGPQVRIQGELSGDEDIVIEGRVEGKVSVSKSLRVGTNAVVNAEVRAHSVVVAGRVVGNVVAVEKVEILPSGSLEGNIRAPKIAIAEGAQFKGSVDMSGGGKDKGAPAAPAASDAKDGKAAPPASTGR